jgi:hypothetical protein
MSMPVVHNKTRKPIRVPLGGGKVLHLGPDGTGQVSPQATERPAFRRLLEQDEIELVAEGGSGDSGSTETGGVRGSTRGHKPPQIQRRGDR